MSQESCSLSFALRDWKVQLAYAIWLSPRVDENGLSTRDRRDELPDQRLAVSLARSAEKGRFSWFVTTSAGQKRVSGIAPNTVQSTAG